MRRLSVIQCVVFIGLLIWAFPGCNTLSGTSDKIIIRVHKVSNDHVVNIVLDNPNHGAVPTDVFSGDTTFGVAYRYNDVKFTAAGALFTIPPLDYVGKTPLGTGNFTCDIDILDVEARPLDRGLWKTKRLGEVLINGI